MNVKGNFEEIECLEYNEDGETFTIDFSNPRAIHEQGESYDVTLQWIQEARDWIDNEF